MGIIDILQTWDTYKRLAGKYKSVRFVDFQGNKIDSVPPKRYGERFREYFMLKIRDTVCFFFIYLLLYFSPYFLVFLLFFLSFFFLTEK